MKTKWVDANVFFLKFSRAGKTKTMGIMIRKAIEFASGIAQENLVNRGVNSVFDFFWGKDNSDSDVGNMESNFNSLMSTKVDVENEIRIKLEQVRKKRKREVEDWLEEVKEVEGEYHAFVEKEQRKGLLKKIVDGNHEAIELNRRICHLHKRSQDFGEVVADDRITGMPRPTTGLVGAAFQDNFKRIWNLLENDQVSSIGVHGMGGVGKSTLVEHINNQLVERNKCVFWVVVSFERCSIKMLQDKIARRLCLDLSDEDDDEGARAGRLNRALSQRENFVLILDDVWERIDLVKLGIPLSLKGCKWMITSRSLKVCQEMNCQEKIAIKPLREDEGWNLFLKNLGQDATSALEDPEVKGIAKRMVELCDGLPLGIITLAGAVSGVTEIQEWRHEARVLKESVMGHGWMEEKVFRVLKYSFDRLNPNDQRCFLYCALYPEDYKIPMEELLGGLIREKLVDEKKSRAAQKDEAHSIVTRLVKVSLLESVFDSMEDDSADECVKMHDLVREMALKITKGKTMVIAGQDFMKEIPKEKEWTKDLEKVSLMMNSIQEIPHGISPNCPKLTTLILRDNPLNEIATSFFTQMCGLRTLDLSETDIGELPDSVSDLLNLTSLLLGGCRNLHRVPCVGKMKELRELDLSGTDIEDAPQGIEELRLQLLRLPLRIKAELVEGWERLEVYRGSLKHVRDFNRLVASKHDRVSYYILLGHYSDYFKRRANDGVTRELIVNSYDLKGGEENELTTILADYIQFLKFTRCDLSKSLLDDLSNPTSLHKLEIIESEGIECMLTYEQYKAPQGSKSPFQALELIHLMGLKDFMGVIHNLEIESDPPPASVFSSLRSLTISGCHKMKKLGLPLSIFEKLEHVSIRYCWSMEEIIQVSAANESDDVLFVSLPNLKQLHLVNLPSLESFCNATVICNSLNQFALAHCPRWQVPFLNWGTPDSYKPLFPEDGVEEIRRVGEFRLI